MSNFNDVEHQWLRAFNRAVFVTNLHQDAGKAPAEDYLSQFSDEEKFEIATIIKLVVKHGVKHIRELVTAGVHFVEYPTSEEALVDVGRTVSNEV